MSSASSTPRDRITLTGLRARGRHGVFDFEKRDGQEFVVDVELRADLSVAGASDDLADTVNYAEVAQAEGALGQSKALALDAHNLEARNKSVAAVTVHKPAAPIPHTFDDVSVRLVRAREAAFVVALGANLGDRAATLTEAVAAVRGLPGVSVTAVSALVETDPVGGPEQGDYLNAVLVGRTSRRPEDLLAELHRIEARHGRARTVRWGERTLDLDLIQFGTPGTPNEVRSADPALLLPHPRASERGFVLLPWLDADPRARIRVGSRVVPVAAQVTTVDLAGVRPVAVGPPHTDPAKGRA